MSAPPGWRRWRTPVAVGVAVVAIALAAAFANIALLGSAGEDRLGRLSPVATPAGGTAPAATDDDGGATTTTGTTTTGTTAGADDRGRPDGDDHGGHGRDHDEDD